MWTKSNKKRIAPTTKHVIKIHVWAAFSSMGTFTLCVMTNNINSETFLDIMEGYLITQSQVYHESHWRLLMDNDPKHTSQKVRTWLAQNVPNQIPWPSQSPDLNLIENLFPWVKQEILKLGPRTIPKLKLNLEGVWNRIQPDFLKPYWKSMPRRCQLVVEGNGYPINY
ncbi:hypothetical protein LOD99_11039 [Oopsacas minuta]|uniref:Tc1-like transposase DDE domain-containing protein n=1 Tax=Oopsacas minuta TaxID=111878 RepID=A0AAV7KB18_9METZ|nr:hypothetical protein LOD99_11039 [Oopsacas minuta]